MNKCAETYKYPIGNMGTAGITSTSELKRQTVAAEILSLSAECSRRAQDLTEKAANKLHPIMCASFPTTDCIEEKDVEYSPYFNELRDYLHEIKFNLINISETIDRVEL